MPDHTNKSKGEDFWIAACLHLIQCDKIERGMYCKRCGEIEAAIAESKTGVNEMRRKAFWGRAMARQVPGLVNGELVNFGINEYGVQFARRDNGQLSRLIPWAELHRLAQQSPLEQLGAAVAERSEPVCILKLCNKPAIAGRCLCALHAEECDRDSEPRILPVEEK